MRAILTLTLLALLAGAADAGTRSSPEVGDPRGDTTHELTGASVNAPDADLVAVWIEESRGRFEVHVRVANLDAGAPGRVDLWRVTFLVGARSYTAEVQRSADGTWGSLHVPELGGQGPSTFDGTASVALDPELDEVVLDLPRAFALTTATGTEEVAFEKHTLLAAIQARTYQGHGTSQTGLLLLLTDHAGTGAFQFATRLR